MGTPSDIHQLKLFAPCRLLLEVDPGDLVAGPQPIKHCACVRPCSARLGSNIYAEAQAA